MTPGKRNPLGVGLMLIAAWAVILAACGESTLPSAETSKATPTTSVPSETTSSTGEPAEDTLAGVDTTLDVPADLGVETPSMDDHALEVTVAGGEVLGGVETLQAEVGSMVRIIVTTDTADHVHVHGYDLFFDTFPEEPTEVIFFADLPGVFEVELEEIHLEILRLEVR